MGQSRAWKQDEIEYMEDSWGSVSIPTIAKNLNRTVNAVKCKSQRIGLTRHIHSGEYLTFNQLLVALGMGETYQRVKLINAGIPIKHKASIKTRYKIIYLDDFWKWAENNKQILNFKNFTEGDLGVEPDWVRHKRLSDKKKAQLFKTTPWTRSEDEQLKWLLNQYKFGYHQISKMLHRSEGAIKRRMCDLKIKARPIKAENHRSWEEWETELLIQMYQKGYTYEDISEKLNNRSVCAVRGKVERLQYTKVIPKR